MKRDGEATRRRIVAKAANLLNTKGYLGTPISEIMRVTGLKKGGIYNHFKSRDALTMEAFNYGAAQVRARLLKAVEGKGGANEKLSALFGVFRNFAMEEVFQGGCPIMNLAIESDDADPSLREAARNAMSQLIGLIERLIVQGMQNGEFAKGDARARATMLAASLEGGIMLSNLYKDYVYLQAVVDHLERQVQDGLH